jgi:hypothetical protein
MVFDGAALHSSDHRAVAHHMPCKPAYREAVEAALGKTDRRNCHGSRRKCCLQAGNRSPDRDHPTAKHSDRQDRREARLLVKFNGKPLVNAGVEVTDSATKTAECQPKFMTKAAGVAEVPIGRAGVNVVSVDYGIAIDGSLGKAMKALPVDQVAMIATHAFQVR